MSTFTIRDLENLSGIKAHTIRIWEQRYHFLKPNRTDTNIRYYNNEELKAVLNIALLSKYGFKISHIDKMRPDEIRERILSLADPRAVQERTVNELIQQMVDMEPGNFEKIITSQIMQKGLERTVTQVIFPFLEKIGLLWLTGNINPAQEHLVTNIIRQKLIVAIESNAPHLQVNKTILMFLPEGEHHELGLLYLYYLLKSRGVKIIYLGANVPLKDAAFVVQLKKPDLVYIHLTASGNGFHFEKFLKNIHLITKDTEVVISGHLTQEYKKPAPANVQFLKSLPEVIDFTRKF